MEAKEITIGSIIKQEAFIILERGFCSYVGRTVTERKFNDEQIIVDKLNIRFVLDNIDSYVGIPLTEEWLLNFGFKGLSTSNYLGLLLGIIYFRWDKESKYLDFELDYESVQLPHIKYVHQLQNLYFALTGDELTLKD